MGDSIPTPKQMRRDLRLIPVALAQNAADFQEADEALAEKVNAVLRDAGVFDEVRALDLQRHELRTKHAGIERDLKQRVEALRQAIVQAEAMKAPGDAEDEAPTAAPRPTLVPDEPAESVEDTAPPAPPAPPTKSRKVAIRPLK
jgi:hypothetical protein